MVFEWIRVELGEPEKAEEIASTLEYDRHPDPCWDPFAARWNVTATTEKC